MSATVPQPCAHPEPAPPAANLYQYLELTATLAQAQTVTPLQGQNPQQIQSDIAACQAQAGTTPSSTTTSSSDDRGGERDEEAREVERPA